MLFQRLHGARDAGREAVQLRGGLVLLRRHSLVHRQEETALEVRLPMLETLNSADLRLFIHRRGLEIRDLVYDFHLDVTVKDAVYQLTRKRKYRCVMAALA